MVAAAVVVEAVMGLDPGLPAAEYAPFRRFSRMVSRRRSALEVLSRAASIVVAGGVVVALGCYLP